MAPAWERPGFPGGRYSMWRSKESSPVEDNVRPLLVATGLMFHQKLF